MQKPFSNKDWKHNFGVVSSDEKQLSLIFVKPEGQGNRNVNIFIR